MRKKWDIVSIGEILIDFVSKEQNIALPDVTEYKRAAGGGPANVAVGAARLGKKVGFIGKVGRDAFGRHLIQTLEQNGVDTEGVAVDSAADTTLVFVALNQAGIPDFSFFRHGTADTLLRAEELPIKMLQETKVLHFSSVALTTEPARSACLKAVDIAREAGALISFDPNIRLPLWQAEQTARDEILAAVAMTDILKMNDEEYMFLTGNAFSEHVQADESLWKERVKLLIVTRGDKGSVLFTRKETVSIAGFPVSVVDTTGAGDAFMAAILTNLAGMSLQDSFHRSQLEGLGRWAGVAAALACQRIGGIPSLPDLAEVQRFMEREGVCTL